MSGDRARLTSLFERIVRVYPEEFRRLFAEDMADEFSRRCADTIAAEADSSSTDSRSEPASRFCSKAPSSARGPIAVGAAREAKGAAHSGVAI